MSTKVTFQKILELLNSTEQNYELISTEEYFKEQCKNSWPSLVKLEFKCTMCGAKTYKSYNSLLATKNIGICRECAMNNKSIKENKDNSQIVYKIYKITSLDTNKSYVGVTSLEVEERWASGSGYCKQKQFYSDIIKYGWNRFKKEILSESNDLKESRKLEAYYIKEFNCIYPNGYNIFNGVFNICSSKEGIKNIFQINKNGEIEKEWKNISELKKQYSENMIRSIRTSLFNAKNNELTMSSGYFWVLLEDLDNYKKEDYENHYVLNSKYSFNKNNENKIVYQYSPNGELIKSYKTKREVEKINPIFKKSSILKAIQSKKLYKGYFWSYDKTFQINERRLPSSVLSTCE